MNDRSDHELLQEYARYGSNAAFTELVQRYIDLVYSAALRMTRDKSPAESVTQEVFVALAQNARSLDKHPVLVGWLHRTTHNIAANTIRSNLRRQNREQKVALMNDLLANAPEPGWEEIAPQLDAALANLSEPDRDAVLLRYFQGKSAQEMAQAMGTSSEAAQKRVSRAVERLRELLAVRGITVGVGGLVLVVSANAVQAAPPGLAAAVCTAVTVSKAGIAATTAKAIAMTTLQKAVVATTILAAVGTGLLEHRHASTLRAQVQALRQREALLGPQLQNVQREHADTLQQLAALRDENQRLKNETAELVKLRGQVGTLRVQLANTANGQSQPAQLPLSSAQAADAISLPIPTEAHPMSGRALVKWDNALLLGNVKTPSGKTAGLFAIPKRGEVATQLRIETRLVVWPNGFVAPPTGSTPEAKALGVLSAEQSDMLLKAMKDSGAEILGSPSVSIQSGGQAQIEIGGTDQAPGVFPGQIPSQSALDIASGDSSSLSGQKSVIRVEPNISNDGGSVDLAVETWFDTSSSAKENVQ